MRTLVRAPVRRGARLFPLLSAALVVALLAPYGVGIISQARAVAPGVSATAPAAYSGAAFWDGVNVATAPNPSSAISWSFSNTANVKFTWLTTLQLPAGEGVSQAFLVILFLGFPAYTKQQVQSLALPAGQINMTYDLTEFKWYLQGVYELHAYLEDPSGNTLWSENFYVRVAQPYDIVVATVGLILLTIAELYLIVTVGPRALDRTSKTSSKASTETDAEASAPDASTPSEKS